MNRKQPIKLTHYTVAHAFVKQAHSQPYFLELGVHNLYTPSRGDVRSRLDFFVSPTFYRQKQALTFQFPPQIRKSDMKKITPEYGGFIDGILPGGKNS
jgi:hypothetical protein